MSFCRKLEVKSSVAKMVTRTVCAVIGGLAFGWGGPAHAEIHYDQYTKPVVDYPFVYCQAWGIKQSYVSNVFEVPDSFTKSYMKGSPSAWGGGLDNLYFRYLISLGFIQTLTPPEGGWCGNGASAWGVGGYGGVLTRDDVEQQRTNLITNLRTPPGKEVIEVPNVTFDTLAKFRSRPSYCKQNPSAMGC
jgi:hypothetical protein